MRPQHPGLRPALTGLALAALAAAAITASYAGTRHERGPSAPADRVAPNAEPRDVPAKPSDTTPPATAKRTKIPPSARPTSAHRAPYGAAGVMISIDPETGRTTMPSVEARRAAGIPELDRSMQGLVVERKANGSKMVDLQGRFQEYMVLELTPDGRKVERCVRPEELGTVLAPAAAAPPPEPPAPSTEGR